MAGVAAWAIPAVVGAAGIASQSDASRKAANTAKDAAGVADPFASQRPQFQQWLAANFPTMISPNPNDILKNPNFQFLQTEGMRGVKNQNSADFGSNRNGTFFEDMSRFNQGLAAGFIPQQFQMNMAALNAGGQFAGAGVGNPGAAGGLMSQGAQNYVGNMNSVFSQMGGMAALLRQGNTGTWNPMFTNPNTGGPMYTGGTAADPAYG